MRCFPSSGCIMVRNSRRTASKRRASSGAMSMVWCAGSFIVRPFWVGLVCPALRDAGRRLVPDEEASDGPLSAARKRDRVTKRFDSVAGLGRLNGDRACDGDALRRETTEAAAPAKTGPYVCARLLRYQ